MQNYRKLIYKNYFAEKQNGKYIPVTRRKCFAACTPTTTCNPYPQRLYGPEASYVVRLARTKNGDTPGKRNAADLKSAERYQNKKFQFIWKNTKTVTRAAKPVTTKIRAARSNWTRHG